MCSRINSRVVIFYKNISDIIKAAVLSAFSDGLSIS